MKVTILTVLIAKKRTAALLQFSVSRLEENNLFYYFFTASEKIS
jgi:hypothetical protein